MIHDENEYTQLRRQLLLEPTVPEHARASRIAKQTDYKTLNSTTESLVKTKLIQRQQRDSSIYPNIIHYTHQKQFTHYKSQIHKIWDDSFKRTPIITDKLIVGIRNQPNLQKEFVRRSPYPPKQNKQNRQHRRRPHPNATNIRVFSSNHH